jgi:hypothetical protein
MPCECSKLSKGVLAANFSTGAEKKSFDGKEYLVVPVVMLRETVVNGAYVDASELMAEAWNGVPVTLRHPTNGDTPISANSPETLTKFQVGTIFNAHIDGDKLKAEAWIDIAKMNALGQSALLAKLAGGAPMDVSTGYFAKTEESGGVYNGKEYIVKHQDLKPDHLALLPDEEGACNWNDGCGVRANKKEGLKVKTKELLITLAKALGVKVNVEENPMTKEKMVDLLINKKKAVESDRAALLALNEETLTAMTDGLEETDKPAAPAAPAAPTAAAPAAPAAIDANAIAAAVTAALQASPELNAAKALLANNRKQLIDRIVANSKMTAESLKDMSDVQLQTIANGLKPVANYSARGGVVIETPVGEDAEELKAMSSVGNIADFIKAKREGGSK